MVTPVKITEWKCDGCGRQYSRKVEAEECEKHHKRWEKGQR